MFSGWLRITAFVYSFNTPCNSVGILIWNNSVVLRTLQFDRTCSAEYKISVWTSVAIIEIAKSIKPFRNVFRRWFVQGDSHRFRSGHLNQRCQSRALSRQWTDLSPLTKSTHFALHSQSLTPVLEGQWSASSIQRRKILKSWFWILHSKLSDYRSSQI